MRCLLLMLFLSSAGYAEIRTAEDLSPIVQELETCGPETLLLLDMGNTLMQSKDAVMDARHDEWRRAWFKQNVKNQKREDIIANVMITEGNIENWRLVDERWPEVIGAVRDRGAKVAVLTKVWTDPSLEGMRIRNLRTLGLPLCDDLSGLCSGELYLYGDGVIETEEELKGPVVQEVCEKLHCSLPQRIVFVDDRLEQVQSVVQACEEMGIVCIGFHYTASRKGVSELDEAIADFQLKTLIKERRWVLEKEAREQIK